MGDGLQTGSGRCASWWWGKCWCMHGRVQGCFTQTRGCLATDRQRTLRELVVGKTLVCQDGRWLIKHGAGDYKTGRSYGERPPLVVAESIYPEVRAVIMTSQTEHALCLVSAACPQLPKSLETEPLFHVVPEIFTGRFGFLPVIDGLLRKTDDN